MPSLKTISTVSMSEIPSDGSSTNDYPIGLLPGNERGNPFLLSQKTCAILRGDVNGFRPSKPLSLAKMPSGANTFRISGYKLKPEDRMQQCYMPCGRRNNNSPASGWHSSTAAICSKAHRRCRTGWLKSLEKLAVGAFPGLLGGRNRKRQGWQRDLAN